MVTTEDLSNWGHQEPQLDKKLGKISKVSFGIGGYQDAQFGLSLTFAFRGSGIHTFTCGGWSFPPDKHAKWTEEDRVKSMGEMSIKICDLLTQAGVTEVNQLQGIPIEATFDGMTMKDWRILDEVL